jgi:hypothetical protein
MHELNPPRVEQVDKLKQTKSTAYFWSPQGQPVDREPLFLKKSLQWARAADCKVRFPRGIQSADYRQQGQFAPVKSLVVKANKARLSADEVVIAMCAYSQPFDDKKNGVSSPLKKTGS